MDTPSPKKKSFGARGAILLAIVIAMLFSSVYPLGRYLSLRREVAALEAQDRQLDQTLDDLQQQRADLLTDAEVERQARERLGFVRPGEVPFAIADPRAQTAEPDIIVPPDEVEQPDDGVLERWWSAMISAVRVS